ncbi:MAG: multicomponent Na+:H+ antiporter subunit F [Elusimicrobia bacterium]|nr:MAG: multicomponent Na+:H+ antiporter subunit F [Elusimicrobiota bacterium]KAF0157318.1 MAG: multicomponent Na+:H+ antiporter subunit F [Elusimicrobiota bacterium]
MFEAAALAVLLAAAMALSRALTGPSIYDRILAVNVMGTKTVTLLALIGFIYERPHFLDIAITYALINFIATIAFLRYRERGDLRI